MQQRRPILPSDLEPDAHAVDHPGLGSQHAGGVATVDTASNAPRAAGGTDTPAHAHNRPDAAAPDPADLVAAMMAAEMPPLDFHLEFQRETFEAMLETHFSGIILYDMQGRTLYASPHSERLTGWSAAERFGRPGYELVHPEDFAEAAQSWMTLLAAPNSEITFEQRILRKDGAVIWVEAHLKNLLGIEPVNAIVGNYHDITERKRAYAAVRESELRQRDLANRDHLTGLPNRRAITAELDAAVRDVHDGTIDDFAFCFIDLDGFKKVNDRLGHPFGDAYLKTTADRLLAAVGPGDIVARIGGDEFAVLSRHAGDRQAAEALAHKLVHTLSNPARIRNHLVQLPACVGVVIGGGRGWSSSEYLQYADAALYAAKQEGTGRVRLFDDILERHMRDQSNLAAELSAALETNQLDLLYQPIIDMPTRRVVGLEALVCWHHPKRGLLRAGSFIHAAEETGFVIPMGEWVFDRVCRDAAVWKRTFGDRAPWVSANLASAQLIRQDFPDFVRDTVASHGVPAGLVRFELTERGLFETEGPWRDRLWQAQACGVPLMLDDFGTGYTSMRYLSEFPISVLKLDREYVAKSTASSPDRRDRALALIGAVGRMGDALNMEVLAEGVETEEQHRAALDAGCHLGQGWLYARAMPFAEICAHLEQDDWIL
ncbi:MAG: EAL domain-containing protein [Alphaproteobacteria bacterium]|nr:EAL domain-containing protein [Alphaproteobacteria bacterium]